MTEQEAGRAVPSFADHLLAIPTDDGDVLEEVIALRVSPPADTRDVRRWGPDGVPIASPVHKDH